MFIRYTNCCRSINMDNFDEIRMIPPYSSCEQYRVVATKCIPKYKLDGSVHTHGSAYFFMSGDASVTIKKFSTEREAKAFFEKLQYHWINKISEIFDVD